MKYLYERVSYLRGLADGLQISEDTKEGKLLIQIVDVLEDFADAVNELAAA
jgi:DNA-directed RNA polymerase subunit delta